MVTVNDYLNLSAAVYGDIPLDKGWHIVNVPDIDEKKNNFPINGVRGEVYENDSGDVVIAYRGTNISGDVMENLPTELKQVLEQAENAMELYTAVCKEFKKSKISMTGHSLGGALAYIISTVSGCYTVTFNSPGVVDNKELTLSVDCLEKMLHCVETTAREAAIDVGREAIEKELNILPGAMYGNVGLIVSGLLLNEFLNENASENTIALAPNAHEYCVLEDKISEWGTHGDNLIRKKAKYVSPITGKKINSDTKHSMEVCVATFYEEPQSTHSIMPGLLLLIVALMGCGVYWFMQSPLYALMMGAYGWQKKELAIFNRYVDVRALTGSSYKKLSPYYVENINRDMKDMVTDIAAKISKDGDFGKSIAKDATAAVTKIDEDKEAKMTDEIEKKAVKLSLDDFSDQARKLLNKGWYLALTENFGSIRTVSKGQDYSVVELKLMNIRKEELVFEFVVKKNKKDDWQLVSIPNIDKILLNGDKFDF